MTIPGDLTHQEKIHRMIRVNHAGEYGAKRIYAGQLAVLKNTPSAETIEHMAEQEQVHLDTFSRMIHERRVRPTALMPLWHVGGYAMGAVTALMGEKAAMACTVAVESVIDDHYAAQEASLGESENELKSVITQFRAEEQEHHDTALNLGAEQSPFYHFLTSAIVLQTKFAIWLSTRV
ncbi:MAG: demethoxyubiquinone hydroxylase family protein [Rickettsiales bacterium]